jgi:hypothetical protein
MGVYIHQNNVQKELKNWFIWEYVEPRTPWANTLLYMPLDWDVYDEVSQTDWTWYWTTTYNTLTSWLKVAYCDSSSYILSPNITLGTSLTISWWVLWGNSGYSLVRIDHLTPRDFYQIATDSSVAWWGFYNQWSLCFVDWVNSWW